MKSQTGQVAVEFAFTLLFLFFFLIVFFEIIYIVITHERVSLANFAFSRHYSVHRLGQAYSAAQTVDPSVSISPGGSSVTTTKDIEIPINMENIFQKGGVLFRVKKESEVFLEPQLSGDN